MSVLKISAIHPTCLSQVSDIKFQASSGEEKESWIKALNEGINRGKNKAFDEVWGVVSAWFFVFLRPSSLGEDCAYLSPDYPSVLSSLQTQGHTSFNLPKDLQSGY